MRKGENKPEGIVGTSELAAIVGKTKQWIGQLTRDGVLTQVARGKYNLAESVQAYIRHITGTSTEGKISYNDEKAQHEQIKKEIAMLELEEKRNNLHTTGDVLDAWGELVVNFRERLQGLPPRMATELSHMTEEKQIRLLMEAKINDALTELAKYDPLAERE
ncbi:hypothetical protein [Paenibacillus pseudetheri]|uniref:Terminase small subunit n=1 Tax=Paenibacillus pseudetheri TaxID=2897682 RepID=A0ABM9BKB7_9BACL|nr:hypothetical protein [Paenibacillus pseudetheri]CAH1058864.1 hypothetical protein PAECIP111894_05050 [Paenibacillus pseudetheri]